MKKFVWLVLLVLSLGLNAGCGQQAQHKELQEITIGLMPDTDSLPFIIAQEKGFFAEEGITVHLQQFKSAMDRDGALQSGNLDGAVSDMLAVGFAQDGGFAIKVTSFTDGSYKLIASAEEPARDVVGLQGKAVAVSKNTIIEYVTDQILQGQGLTATSINKVVIPQIPTRLEMLQNGKLAAATLPEPMASIAIHNGGHLISSSDQLGINPGVIVFTDKTIETKRAEIQAMYRAYNKAVAYLSTAPRDTYIELVLEKGGFPPAARDSLQLPQYHAASLPKEKDVNDCIFWLKEKQLIKQAYSYEDIVVDLFGQ